MKKEAALEQALSSLKFEQAKMRGKVFTMEEAQEICQRREEELKRLGLTNGL